MGTIVGIDFGATNLSVAVADPRPAPESAGERPVVRTVPDPDGARRTAALVALSADGEPAFGAAARLLWVTRPEQVVAGVGAILGRKKADAELTALLRGTSQETIDGPEGAAWVRVAGKPVAPIDVASMLLARARSTAESFVGGTVTGAVLAIRSGSSHASEAALQTAASRAGFTSCALVEQPIAAALRAASGADERLAVYDLGGRTFSISFVDITGGVARVMATRAEAIGGVDFDDRVVELLARRLEQEHRVDARRDRVALARLREHAEKVRHELSSWIEAEVNLPFLVTSTAGTPIHFIGTLTRAEVEMATSDLVERSIEVCRRALRDVGLAATGFDGVVVAGGMGRAVAVERAVAELFGTGARDAGAPDEIIAGGAALYAVARPRTSIAASSLAPSPRGRVSPVAIGVATGEGAVTVLVPRGAPLPAEGLRTFTTSIDDQSFVALRFVAGERPFAEDNRTLAQLELAGIAAMPKGAPRLSVRVLVDEVGAVELSIRDEDMGRSRSLRLTGAFGEGGPRLKDPRVEEDDDEGSSALAALPSSADAAEVRARAEALLYLVETATPGCDALVDRAVLDAARSAAAAMRTALAAPAELPELRGCFERLDALAFAIGKALFARR